MSESDRIESRKRAAIDTLTARYARDELPMDEYERLVSDITGAASFRELAVVEDIAFGPARAAAPAASSEDGAGNDAAGGFLDETAVQSCTAILAERNHRGDWLRKPNVAAATVLASQTFDFTETRLPPGRTTLEVLAVLGEVVVLVPDGLAVRLDVSPVLGEASVARGLSAVARDGEPLLVVTGSAVLGSVVVKRG